MSESIPTGVISSFRNEYYFLSNFYWGAFIWRGERYPTGEHAFQAAKCYHMIDARILDMADYRDKVNGAPSPKKAKYYGRSVKIDVKSWNAQRVQYMREIVHAKFYQVPDLSAKLVNTGVKMLVEGNDWDDTFWGRCLDTTTGKMVGLNTLGTILMEERGYWLHGTIAEA